jgi:hypothetical protein
LRGLRAWIFILDPWREQFQRVRALVDHHYQPAGIDCDGIGIRRIDGSRIGRRNSDQAS